MKRINAMRSIWVAMSVVLIGCVTEEVEPPAKPSEGQQQEVLRSRSPRSMPFDQAEKRPMEAPVSGPEPTPDRLGEPEKKAEEAQPGGDSDTATSPAPPAPVSDDTPGPP
jgi:hypothetical protein